jgi:hypothetical protein
MHCRRTRSRSHRCRPLRRTNYHKILARLGRIHRGNRGNRPRPSSKNGTIKARPKRPGSLEVQAQVLQAATWAREVVRESAKDSDN